MSKLSAISAIVDEPPAFGADIDQRAQRIVGPQGKTHCVFFSGTGVPALA